MIRVVVCQRGKETVGYGIDVTGWEEQKSESGWYDNRLLEDLIERVGEGDVLMYFDEDYEAEDWCDDHGFIFEMINSEEDDNN